MRAEDFTVYGDRYGDPRIACPVGDCAASITLWDDEPSPDLGSLLDAARDHLRDKHPSEGPEP